MINNSNLNQEEEEDDELFNDPSFLAQLDKLETQFTNSQLINQSSSQKNPNPKFQSHHPITKKQKLSHNEDQQNFKSDQTKFLIDDDGLPQISNSPNSSQNLIISKSLNSNLSKSINLNHSQKSNPTIQNPNNRFISRRTSAPLQHAKSFSRHNSSQNLNNNIGFNLINKAIHPNDKGNFVQLPKPFLPVKQLIKQQTSINFEEHDQVIANLRAQVEAANESLKQSNAEKTRLKGEVSIVRSALDSYRSKSSKQVFELKQNEEKFKLRAEQAEKEVQRLKNQKEVQELFKGLEESAKKPTSSLRRTHLPSTQFSPTQNLQPKFLFSNHKTNNLVHDLNTKTSQLHNVFNNSQLHQIPHISSSSANLSSPIGCLTTPRQNKFSNLVNSDAEIHNIAQQYQEELTPSNSKHFADKDPEPVQQSRENDLSHAIVANLFQSLLIDLDPKVGFKSIPSIQKILQVAFDKPEQRSVFDRLVMHLFICLSKPLEHDWPISNDSEEIVLKFIAELGCLILELTKLFSASLMIEALSVSILLLNILCQTTPLFCSLFLNHPDFGVDCDIVPILVTLVQQLTKVKIPSEENFFTQSLQNLLDLMETLVWDPAEVCYSTLEAFLKSEGVMDCLLDEKQPKAVLSQSLSILTSFSCKPRLCGLVLLAPTKIPTQLNNNRTSRRESQWHSIPLIERLVNFLTIDDHSIQMKLLTLLLQLAVKNENGFVLVGHSPSVIAMLIKMIAVDCVLLWNGDGGIEHRIQIPLCVDRLELAMDLIFHLVFDSQAPSILMDHLQEASRKFPGIHHEFVVSFGKLAFSELPSSGYLNKEKMIRLDTISDLAYDLIRSVASPDELEDWKVCATDDSESSSSERASSPMGEIQVDEDESGEIFM
ncbi:hypothetical protein O181_046141 [Austropuccinia psidii MF-1]|uniref:Uncharacterized protein n=1 Tax=Austropuccinia psidii MF-1 TaxID=1389203 RepID=A0A9Q3HIC9_9BASI|nr:hypothetical protein [Austropuccinia psidii MF-1]